MFNFSKNRQVNQITGRKPRNRGDLDQLNENEDFGPIVPPSLYDVMQEDARTKSDKLNGKTMRDLIVEWRDRESAKHGAGQIPLGDLDINRILDDLVNAPPNGWSRRWCLGLLCMMLAMSDTLVKAVTDPEQYKILKAAYENMEQEGNEPK